MSTIDGGRRKHIQPKPPDSTREVGRWQSRGETVIAELQRYGQAEVLAVRRWYPTEDGLKPGRSGISFAVAELDFLSAAINEVRVIATPVQPKALVDPAQGQSTTTVNGARPTSPPAPSRRVPILAPARRVLEPPAPSARSQAPAAAGACLVEIAAKSPPPAELPGAATDQTGVTLAAIIAKGLVRTPLPLRMKTRNGTLTGVVYTDGTLVFGNQRFLTPREAVIVLAGYRTVVDAWTRLAYRNPVTHRFARLSRLRNLYLGLQEGDDADED